MHWTNKIREKRKFSEVFLIVSGDISIPFVWYEHLKQSEAKQTN